MSGKGDRPKVYEMKSLSSIPPDTEQLNPHELPQIKF